MTICIDSQVIVWGIKKQSTEGQENMIGLAEYFFQWADENDHTIILPTIVLAEILAPEPQNIRAKIVDTLRKAFVIVDFDTRAALKYAELLHGRVKDILQLAKEIGTLRQKMKADHMIIATAIVNGCNCLYSYDEGLKKFATGFIDVKEFPVRPAKPLDLFSDVDPMDLVT